MNTKEKIIFGAIELFNRDGFTSVKIQDIASHLEMSLGNFTYHFPKKEDLVLAVYEYLTGEIQRIWTKFEIKANFITIDGQMRFFFNLQKRFSFFYVDTLELFRAYPEIAERHSAHIQKQIAHTKKAILLNRDAGNFEGPYTENQTDLLAEAVWSNIVLWKTKCLIKGVEEISESSMAIDVWCLLKPYFSERGKAQYQKLGYD